MLDLLWSLLTKRERNKDGKGSIKILMHTSRGSKLINKLLHLDVYLSYDLLLHMYLNSIYMLVWCMLEYPCMMIDAFSGI